MPCPSGLVRGAGGSEGQNPKAKVTYDERPHF